MNETKEEAWRHNYHGAFHWFCVFTAGCTLFLLLAGAEVTSRGVGLAVPDWPLSYGQWMPPMVGGIFYEHGHRMVAATVGFLTLILTIWCLIVEQRRWVRWLALGGLGAVVLQGILGGMTVLFLLPDWLSTSHATLGQTFFCLTVALAIVTSKSFLSAAEVTEPVGHLRSLRVWALIAIGVLYGQLVIGGLMRHSESGLAIPTLPLAYGQLFPDLSTEAVEGYRRQLLFQLMSSPDVTPRTEEAAASLTAYNVAIHFAHRVGAVIVAGILLTLAVLSLRRAPSEPMIVALSVAIGGLVILQFTLGLLVILSLKHPIVASLHVLGGALLLAATVSYAIWVYRLPSSEPASSDTLEPSHRAAFVTR